MAQRNLLIMIGAFLLLLGGLITMTVLEYMERDDLNAAINKLKKAKTSLQATNDQLLPMANKIDGLNRVRDSFLPKLPDPASEDRARNLMLMSLIQDQKDLSVEIPPGQISIELPKTRDALGDDAGGGTGRGGAGRGGAGAGELEVSNLQSFQNFQDVFIRFPLEGTFFDFARFLQNLEKNEPFMMVDTFALTATRELWQGDEGEGNAGFRKYRTNMNCRTFFFDEPAPTKKKRR